MDSGRHWKYIVAEMSGWKTVEEMELNMLHSEYTEWVAYSNIKFHLHEKIDYYLAQIAMMFSAKKSKKINDFLVKFKTNRRLSSSELKAKMLSWATGHNQMVKQKRLNKERRKIGSMK